MPKSFLFTNRRYIEHKITWTNFQGPQKHEGSTDQINQSFIESNTGFQQVSCRPTQNEKDSAAHCGPLCRDMPPTPPQAHHAVSPTSSFQSVSSLKYFYPSNVRLKDMLRSAETSSIPSPIRHRYEYDLATPPHTPRKDYGLTSPDLRPKYVHPHGVDRPLQYQLSPMTPKSQRYHTDDNDSDSGCSLSHDEGRPELSPKSACGMDCTDHFALLFEFMSHSPRKADLLRRDSGEGMGSVRRALSFDEHSYVPLIEPLTPPEGSPSPDDEKAYSEMGGEYSCEECGKRYSTSSNLARHRQTHRSICDKKARKCPHCEKVYVSMPAYSMHVRTHSQGCECPYCGKRFSRPWLLQGHIRTHTGEKPFSCPKCSKCFADKSNLRAHIQTHSTEKPYICGRCGKAFALKSYLYKHEESSCMRGQRTKGKQARLDSQKQPMEAQLAEFGQTCSW